MTRDLARTIDVIRDQLAPSWDDIHVERLLACIARVQRRRRVARVAGALGAACLLAVVLGSDAAGSQLAAAQVHGLERGRGAAAPVGVPQRVGLADGSSVLLGSASTKLDVLRNEPAQIELALRVGNVHLDVAESEARSFVVTAGPVRVVVVGSVFEIERGDSQVRVAVSEGQVRIETPGEARHVGPGGRFWFNLSQAAGTQPSAPPVAEAALELDPTALLEAADAARLSHQPMAAAVYLRRLLRDHAASPVAPLAGFTLGRVLLESLGQPAEAAAAFALARRQAPQGSLAQDALAREVEALSKAGRSREAYERAQSYVQQYPTGRRLRAVRLFGGLE